jgi:hypothetical protein
LGESLLSSAKRLLAGQEAPAINVPLPSTVTRIPSDNITHVVSDITSSTLLITLREPINEQTTILFHPVDNNVFSIQLLECIEAYQQAHQPDMDDAVFGIFDTFSKVSRFYYNTARSLLGAEDISRRPRSPRDAHVNPWIVERVIIEICTVNSLVTGPARGSTSRISGYS